MANCTSCGGAGVETRIVPAYEAHGLGAPFRVILEHAVKAEVCKGCGQTLNIFIPDMRGLFHAVVFARALEPRKMSGVELRFMRKAMGWKAKAIAKHLGLSAEYLSRCEADCKVMSEGTEKLFRLYSLLKTPDESALKELDLSKLFDLIEIKPTWDVSEPLTFHFVRRSIPAERSGTPTEQPIALVEQSEVVDEKWRKDQRALRAA